MSELEGPLESDDPDWRDDFGGTLRRDSRRAMNPEKKRLVRSAITVDKRGDTEAGPPRIPPSADVDERLAHMKKTRRNHQIKFISPSSYLCARRLSSARMNATSHRVVSGLSFIGVGVIMVLGIITAQSFVPGYSTAHNTISALGAARGTPGSRAVFNPAIVLSGLLLVVAAYGLHHVYGRRLLTGLIGFIGVAGLMGVGLFPSQTGLPHLIASVITFLGMGVTALVVTAIVEEPFRYVSAVIGALELAAFVLSFWALIFDVSTQIGLGGLERWTAYLGLLWITAFGGFLLGYPKP